MKDRKLVYTLVAWFVLILGFGGMAYAHDAGEDEVPSACSIAGDPGDSDVSALEDGEELDQLEPSHGGGLNSCGCHFNRSQGTCHCHQDRGCGCECQPARCG